MESNDYPSRVRKTWLPLPDALAKAIEALADPETVVALERIDGETKAVDLLSVTPAGGVPLIVDGWVAGEASS